MSRILVIAFAAFTLLGCQQDRHTPACTIALLDISASIYPEEVDREFTEMQHLASHLDRGDELILIPITGNARNDTPGRIVRLLAPLQRSSFDTDLATFHNQANTDIAAMKAWAKQNLSPKTDILGTLAVAQEEDGAKPSSTKLIIMSDFLEDDGETKFSTEPALASTELAIHFADQVHRKLRMHSWAEIETHVLRSPDAAALPAQRMRAIDAFWKIFYKTPIPANAVEP